MTDSGNLAGYESASHDLTSTLADRAQALQRSAHKLIRSIIGLLIAGLVMIIGLPPLITQIDRSIAVAGVQHLIDQLQSEIQALNVDLTRIEQFRLRRTEELNREVADYGLVWNNSLPDIFGSVTDVTHIGRGHRYERPVLIAVGYEGSLIPEELCTSPRLTQKGDLLNFIGDQTPLILRSQDGEPWKRVDVPGIRGGLFQAVDVTNPTKMPVYHATVALGRAQDGSLILRSEDFGLTWTRVRPAHNVALYDILEIGNGHLVAIGESNTGASIISSSDDGRKWEPVLMPVVAGKLIKIAAVDHQKQNFVAVGCRDSQNKPLMLYSEDGAKSWAESSAPDLGRPVEVVSIAVGPQGNLLAVGRSQGSGVIFTSENGGRNWTHVDASDAPELRSIAVARWPRLVAVGEWQRRNDQGLPIMISENGGTSWTRAHGPAVNVGSLVNLQILKDNRIFAVGGLSGIHSSQSVWQRLEMDLPTDALIVRSGDSGQTWELEKLHYIKGYVRNVLPLEDGKLLAIGHRYSMPAVRPGLDEVGKPMALIFVKQYFETGLTSKSDLADLVRVLEERTDIPLKTRQEWLREAHLWRDQRDDVQRHIRTLFNNVEQIRRDSAEQATKDPWVRQLSIQGTRVAVILILIFLVQVLVNIYRYQMRLSAFYLARADALALVSQGTKERVVAISALTEAFTPNVNFSRESPIRVRSELSPSQSKSRSSSL